MIKTMAVKITDETYPIACACLPGAFATFPVKRVLGAYLVINDIDAIHIDGDRSPSKVLTNKWVASDSFWKNYDFVEDEDEMRFIEVVKI